MSSRHLITYRDLSLLRDIDADRLINTRRQFISVISCKYFRIYNNTIFTVGHLKRSISYLTGLFTEDRTQQPLFCGKLCLSFRSHLADKNISCTNFRTDPDNSALIQIFQRLIAHARDISCDLFRPKLCVTSLCLIFFNVNGSIHILLNQSLAQQNGILIVVTFPGHKPDQRVLAKRHLTV